jgi:hypothetical protein
MNSYIYGGISRISSTQTFAQYRESESYNQAQRAVNKNGDLLDYETLELRVHPPNIQVKIEEKETLVTLDSANKPGTLIEVAAPTLSHESPRRCHPPRKCSKQCMRPFESRLPVQAVQGWNQAMQSAMSL